MTRTLLIALLVAVGACSQQTPESSIAPATSAQPAEAVKPEPLPEVDAQSPDSLVKSYWALQEWMARNKGLLGVQLKMSDDFRELLKMQIALSTGERRAKLEEEYAQLDKVFTDDSTPPAVIQRDIIEVKSESETRAVVIAKLKNITPLPPEIDLSIWREDRDYGLDVKYVVEKTPDGWRLTQAWKRGAGDIKYDKDFETGEPKTGGWKKVWEVTPKGEGQPTAFHYSYVEP